MIYEVFDDAGLGLDAHLEVHDDRLIFHSRGGAKGTIHARNIHYSQGLRLLLERLLLSQLKITGAWVDSNRVQALPLSDRLVLTPAEISQGAAQAFSLLSKRVPVVGSATKAAKGGNSHKRLAIGLANSHSSEWLAKTLGLRVRSDKPVCAPTPRIFASSVWGMDFDKWGAWGFADEGTRNKLAAEIGPGDYVLSIGTKGKETEEAERGRLLALIQIGSQLIGTSELVEPAFYKKSIDENNGIERWPYGFPIKRAEKFSSFPLRSDALPRIHEKNLFMKLARHYVELTPDEVTRVLGLARIEVDNIYSTPKSSFVARLRKSNTGPPPAFGTRTLTAKSGPAATYVMKLRGSAMSHMDSILPSTGCDIFKVGYSNAPKRRHLELNAYLPCEKTLKWEVEREQWHDDEINAYAMEQEVFRLLAEAGIARIKGEIVACRIEDLEDVWARAKTSTRRPIEPVFVQALDTN